MRETLSYHPAPKGTSRPEDLVEMQSLNSVAKGNSPLSCVVTQERGWRPRGVTPRPRSGAAAESTRLRRHRKGREELPHVRGQGGQPKGDTQHPRSGAVTRGVTPRARSGAVAGRRYPRPQARGQGWRVGGATQRLRPGAVAGRTNSASKELWLRGRRRA